MPTLRTSRFWLVAFLLLAALFLGGCTLTDPQSWLKFWPGQNQSNAPVTLTYWGLFTAKEVLAPLIKEYQEKHPHVTIDYSPRSFSSLAQYKELLLSRLSQGTGPDILRLHVSWLPPFASVLAPLPPKVMTEKEYRETFFPVAAEAANLNGSFYALPLQYDGLALYINDEALAEGGGKPPRTWEEFRQLAVKLTKTEKENPEKVLRAGAALGNAANIPHAADILSLMLAQSDLNFPADLDSEPAQHALIFYTNFLKKDRVWDPSLPNAVVAFARGQVAMILAPAWRLVDIANLNPGLKFSLNPVPQLPALSGREQTNVNWASFWVEGVSAKAKNKEVAWDFLKFLSSPESLKKMHSYETQFRPVGQLYPRQDLVSDLSVDPKVAAVLAGASSARTSLLTDWSGNDPYVEAVTGAIEAVVKGSRPPAEALKTARRTIEQLLGLSTSPPPPRR